MKKDNNLDKTYLRMAIDKQLFERYKMNMFELLTKLWIGMFMIAGFLGAILIFALLIIHPFSLFILCATIVFITILKLIGGTL